MKKIILFAPFLFSFIAKGQDNYTMKFLPQLQQSQWVNASNQPVSEVCVGLPAVSALSFYVYNSGFTYHDVFQTVNDSIKTVNMGAIFNQLKPINYVSFGVSVPLFSINYAKDNVSIGFSINDKMDFQFSYPADFFKFLWYGNGNSQYLGKSADVGNFGLNGTYYREYALHAAYTYKKWTFGMSPKLLYGKTNVNTVESSLLLNTDPNFYTITATAKMNIQTSGIPDSTDNANNGGYFNSFENVINYVFNTQNMGYAIDLGAKYVLNDHINISAGINNVGYINWKGMVHNYTVDQKTFVFDGLHLEDFFQGDTNSVSSPTLRDSIKNMIKFNKDSKPYTTYLPYDFFILGNYQFKHHWFGLELTARQFNNQFLYAGTLCYQLKFGNHFTGALTYTIKSYSTFNIGGGIIFQFLNMQVFVVTDNWWAAVTPLDSKNANINVGLNIAAGRRIKNDKKPIIDQSADFQPIPTESK